MEFDDTCVIEDADAVGAKVLWVLYEVLEGLDPWGACCFARDFAPEVTLSAVCLVTDQSIPALVNVTARLDDLSPEGFYFGIDPLGAGRMGWWPERAHV